MSIFTYAKLVRFLFKPLRSFISSLAGWFFCLYFFFAFLFVFGSDFVLFQPPRPATYAHDTSIIRIPVPTGAISARYLANSRAEWTILLSHGNAEDLGTLLPFIKYLYAQGFSVLAYDYQGYGTSTGIPTEEHTYQDITTAYHYLTQTMQIPAHKIILFGRSLGTGPSVELATRYPCAALILESPFVSAFRVQTYLPLFPFDKYHNLEKIKSITVPILIIHATHDNVIPWWHGRKIFAASPALSQAYWVEKANHNNIFAINPELYMQKIKEFLRLVKEMNH